MKAAQINEYGAKDVLVFTADAPKPSIEANQVLVAVKAAGVNPFDWKVREGYMQQNSPLTFPATLGGDFAGVIAEVGADVTGLSVGDEVFGQANALSGQGSYAEFTPAKADSVAPKPKTLDFATSAALPLVGVSAYQALVEHMKLQKGQRVLIHGGAGGIGSIAIQLAKHLGAYVATTVAADDIDFAKSLGADETIDYKSQDFAAVLKDFDAVYDTVGGETYTKSFSILKPSGVIVSMLEQPDEMLQKERGVTAIAQFTRVTTERLEQLAGLVDEGSVKPLIDKTFPLENAAEALGSIQEGAHRGKVVIVVDQD